MEEEILVIANTVIFLGVNKICINVYYGAQGNSSHVARR